MYIFLTKMFYENNINYFMIYRKQTFIIHIKNEPLLPER